MTRFDTTTTILGESMLKTIFQVTQAYAALDTNRGTSHCFVSRILCSNISDFWVCLSQPSVSRVMPESMATFAFCEL